MQKQKKFNSGLTLIDLSGTAPRSNNHQYFPNNINTYRISSNNNRGRLFLFSHQKGAINRGKVIIRGRRFFQILLSESRALNILFYFPLNQKIITSNKLNMGFLSVPNLFP